MRTQVLLCEPVRKCAYVRSKSRISVIWNLSSYGQWTRSTAYVYARTHRYSYIRAYVRIYMYITDRWTWTTTPSSAFIPIFRTPARTHNCMHTRAHTRAHTRTHAHAHSYAHTHTHSYAHSYAHAPAHAHNLVLLLRMSAAHDQFFMHACECFVTN